MKYHDYKNLFLFYKIKSFEDLLKITNSEKFNALSKKMETARHSFHQIGINDDVLLDEEVVPTVLYEEYEAEKENVVKDGIEHTKELVDPEDWEHIQSFLEGDFFKSRPTARIDTTLGKQYIGLEYAENFRFKAAADNFSLFTLSKNDRNIIIPQNDNSVIFAVDFRQFEFRTNLLLLGRDELLQEQNLYEKIGAQLGFEADDVKLKIISSLYAAEIRDEKVKEFLDRDKILSKIDKDVFWYKGNPVYVPYDGHDGKKIHTITQSISQFYYLRKLKEINQLFWELRDPHAFEKPKSSFIYPLHDSMIFSIHEDDMWLMEKIIEILTNHVYKVKCFIGPNYKDIEEI